MMSAICRIVKMQHRAKWILFSQNCRHWLKKWVSWKMIWCQQVSRSHRHRMILLLLKKKNISSTKIWRSVSSICMKKATRLRLRLWSVLRISQTCLTKQSMFRTYIVMTESSFRNILIPSSRLQIWKHSLKKIRRIWSLCSLIMKQSRRRWVIRWNLRKKKSQIWINSFRQL